MFLVKIAYNFFIDGFTRKLWKSDCKGKKLTSYDTKFSLVISQGGKQTCGREKLQAKRENMYP